MSAWQTVRRGTVYLVGAGPGDPGLITLRGLACLAQAGVVVYDRLVNRWLLGCAGGAERIDVGKQPDHHAVPQAEINRILVEQARLDKVVVRLKGGDPFVFGRGGEEALALAAQGIPFEIVPGVTSAIAAPAYAGIPVTHRGVAASVAFVTAHRASEGLPAEAPDGSGDQPDTLVFLMGVDNLSRVVESLLASGRPLDTPVAIVQQGTYPTQKTVVGSLANIVELSAQVRPPAVTIVGEVVRLREQLAWFETASLGRPANSLPLSGLRLLHAQVRLAKEGGPELFHRVGDGLPAWLGGLLRSPGNWPPELLKLLSPLGPSSPSSAFPHVSAAVPLHVELPARLAQLGAEVLAWPVADVVLPDDLAALDTAIHSLQAGEAGGGTGPNGGTASLERSRSSAFERSGCDWVWFASVPAAVLFCERLFALGGDARWLHGVKLGAVGPAAAVLRAVGLVADCLAQDISGLAQAIGAALEGRRILLPCLDGDGSGTGPNSFGRSERYSPLAQRFFADFETVVVGRLRPVALNAAALAGLQDEAVDAVLFQEPEALQAVAGMLALPGAGETLRLKILERAMVVCGSAATAQAARLAGIPVAITLDGALAGSDLYLDQLVEALQKCRAP